MTPEKLQSVRDAQRNVVENQFQKIEIAKENSILEFRTILKSISTKAENLESLNTKIIEQLEEKYICDSGFYKYDVNTESLIRDNEGLCIPVEIGEPGLLLVAINKQQIFDGYIGNPQMTESKRIRNLKTKGDVFFNSGDLFVKDEDYNLYFNDRIGDTYRWKGENVSTTEVSNMLTYLAWVEDASVYGVDMLGEEGKAGMATLLILPEIQTLDTTRLDELSHHCTDVLSMYARPVFIHIKYGELDMTSTLKQNKTKIKQDGFNVNNIEDPVFYFDKVSKTYKPLTIEVYNDIVSKKVLF